MSALSTPHIGANHNHGLGEVMNAILRFHNLFVRALALTGHVRIF